MATDGRTRAGAGIHGTNRSPVVSALVPVLSPEQAAKTIVSPITVAALDSRLFIYPPLYRIHKLGLLVASKDKQFPLKQFVHHNAYESSCDSHECCAKQL